MNGYIMHQILLKIIINILYQLKIIIFNNLFNIKIESNNPKNKSCTEYNLKNKSCTEYNLNESCEHLICPITLKIFKDPIMSKSGVTYEKKAIIKWLKNNKTDPLSREPLSIEDLRPNLVIKNIINMIPKKDYHINYLYIDELIDCFDETKEKFMKESTIVEYDNISNYHKHKYCLLTNTCTDTDFNVNEYVYTDLLNFDVECNGTNRSNYIIYKELYELKQLSNFLNCPKLYNLAECILLKVNKEINDLNEQFEADEEYHIELRTELKDNNEKLKKNNEELKKNNDILKKNYEILKKKNDILCTENNQLKNKNDILYMENNELKKNPKNIKYML
jgi:hypothetical protein